MTYNVNQKGQNMNNVRTRGRKPCTGSSQPEVVVVLLSFTQIHRKDVKTPPLRFVA